MHLNLDIQEQKYIQNCKVNYCFDQTNKRKEKKWVMVMGEGQQSGDIMDKSTCNKTAAATGKRNKHRGITILLCTA